MDLVCATILRDGKADCVTSPAVLACSTWTALVEEDVIAPPTPVLVDLAGIIMDVSMLTVLVTLTVMIMECVLMQ